MAIKKVEELFNELHNRGVIDLSPYQPHKLQFPDGFRWLYYGKLELKRGAKAFCYSTTRNANGKFLSWVYQPRIKDKKWDFVKVVEHCRRKDAAARAYRLYKDYTSRKELQ